MAYHEAGHAVVGWFLEHVDPLLKVGLPTLSESARQAGAWNVCANLWSRGHGTFKGWPFNFLRNILL